MDYNVGKEWKRVVQQKKKLEITDPIVVNSDFWLYDSYILVLH